MEIKSNLLRSLWVSDIINLRPKLTFLPLLIIAGMLMKPQSQQVNILARQAPNNDQKPREN